MSSSVNIGNRHRHLGLDRYLVSRRLGLNDEACYLIGIIAVRSGMVAVSDPDLDLVLACICAPCGPGPGVAWDPIGYFSGLVLGRGPY